MRSTQTTTVVAVEELVEENILAEMRVTVELGVATVACTTALHVATEDVDETVLDLIGSPS